MPSANTLAIIKFSVAPTDGMSRTISVVEIFLLFLKKLYGVEYTPIGDRIVAGTYMIGATMCGGDITLKGINCEYLSALVSKLSKTTCNIYANNDIIRIKSKGRHPRHWQKAP